MNDSEKNTPETTAKEKQFHEKIITPKYTVFISNDNLFFGLPDPQHGTNNIVIPGYWNNQLVKADQGVQMVSIHYVDPEKVLIINTQPNPNNESLLRFFDFIARAFRVPVKWD